MKLFRSRAFHLAVILAVSLYVRAWGIGTNPPALSWDEASIGYNAFSILTHGIDEHGRFLPLDTFPAFGDYKPPLPVYLTVPFVAIFGLTETAVRLPSVVSGVLAVWLLYVLCLRLFVKNGNASFIGLVAAGLLAVTPWHVMLSRAGFEANIATTLLLAGIVLFVSARNNPKLYSVCWIPFVAGVYTFNSARYSGPLIALPLFAMAWAQGAAARKYVLRGAVIAFLLLLPIVPHLISPQSRLRFREVSIFTDLRTVLTSNTRREADGFTALSGILHNRRIGYAREYLIHFFDNLEPRFLFIRGDGNPKFSTQDTGQLLLVTFPFLFYGFLSVFRDYPVLGWFFLWWLVASIAPTAVARETPHALRIENGLPVFILFTAYGLTASFTLLRTSVTRYVAMFVFAALFVINTFYFWHTLTRHYPLEYSGEWQYGYKQAIETAAALKGSYDTVVLTESIGRPYIYALFYERYDVKKFLADKDASFDAAGFYNVYGFDKYRFTREGIGNYGSKVLYILSPKDVPVGAHIIKEIKLLDGKTTLVVFD